MKVHTPNGRKMLNKICLHCKHLMCKIDVDNGEVISFCSKTQEATNEFGTCDEFEFE